ncbi:MAG: glycosyltransferase family 2 protein [Omnitrophica WOR_2 bacterium]
MPAVSVIMPTYKQDAFIRRAIDSLFAQTMADWELLIIDDGSPDQTYASVEPFLVDKRVSYHRLENNLGLGAALNYGLARTQSNLVAYLPSDDVYYRNHLESLAQCLKEKPEAVLAYSGVKHHYNKTALGQISGYPLQLVQVMHRWTPHRWMDREELVTDDLDKMFWLQLHSRGSFVYSAKVTCEWVDHPLQRHKILQEPVGGINLYRQYFGTTKPLRFHTTVGNYIDEIEHYRQFRERKDTPIAKDGLKILLVGELAYNAERVLALEERGHKLYGLWMPDPYWYNMVGPLPFGHVEDVSRDHWKEAVHRIKPDIIYALLNWQAVPFAHYVMEQNPGIPFVWHFKEGPFICLEKGTWKQLIDLYQKSDGQIYSSPEMRLWFNTVNPGSVNADTSLDLDGDLPKRDWLTDQRTKQLSETDGEIHTVVTGRPIGLHPQNVVELAEQGIHLHFYGDFTHGQWLEWIEKTLRLAPQNIHLHRQVDQDGWVKEFSRYDAGWLHFFKSENYGEIRKANWDDLNYPARIATLLAAGIPLLQRDNHESIVATQSLADLLDIGLYFTNMRELREQLDDSTRLSQLHANAWRQRELFTFDYHVDRLVEFFHKVIDRKKNKARGQSFSIPLAEPVESGKTIANLPVSLDTFGQTPGKLSKGTVFSYSDDTNNGSDK